MKVIQKMADRAFKDPYLKELIHKLEMDYCRTFFDQINEGNLIEKDLEHLLRF